MSNNLNLEALLKAVNQATRPFNAIQAASASLSGDIRATEQALRALNRQASQVNSFRQSSAQLTAMGQSLKQAKQEAAALAVQFKSTENPGRVQIRTLASAKKSAGDLQLQYNALRLSVQRQRQELGASGINTRQLSTHERRLKNSISETTAQLNRQRDARKKNRAQQTKSESAVARYQSGRALAGRVGATGATRVAIASKGAAIGKKLLMPGYALSQKSAELQAVLGLKNASPELNAMKSQARALSYRTGAPASDAVAAQIVAARSGADAGGVLAQAPAILKMSMVNNATMEDNASLLSGTQSAFGLPDDSASHIADVISMTMDKSQATFAGLSDSLVSVAPAAKSAGMSLEETAAMIGVLHDAQITGAKAGMGSLAVLNRLQAPDGKTNAALSALGVKTTDSAGNSRPVFAILKEMQASLGKNGPGAGQRAAYLNTLFGEEGAPAASALMSAAASGKLEKLTGLNQQSEGRTDAQVAGMQNNLGGDISKLQAASDAVGIDLYDQQDGALRTLTQTATQYVLTLDGWMQKNKGLTQTLGLIAGGATALIGIVGVIGTVASPVILGINALIFAAGTLSTVFTVVGGAIATVIGGLSLPVVAVVAAIVAGALLIRQFWEPLSAFFSGVIEGVSSAFAPVGEMFTPLVSIFDGLGEKLKGVWQWFTDLIAPVKSTQETLNSCRDTGVIFGQVLADALMLPLNAFNKLRSGASWLLEKLGIIKTESSTLDQKAVKANEALSSGTQNTGYSYLTRPVGVGYRPLATPAGRTYIDQSRPTYQINVPGNGMPGGLLGDNLQAAMAQYDRQKRSEARASMMHD